VEVNFDAMRCPPELLLSEFPARHDALVDVVEKLFRELTNA
jgi:hypothetical protein